ncbi:MAG: MFS transporter [Chloroflexi bacterium]|nr:MFS transporter [Chloroflexota bacterium]
MSLKVIGSLWRKEHRRRTFMLWTYAFAFGFFTFGFLSWLPSVLKAAGLTDNQVALYTTLMDLTAFPAAALTAFLYFRWSTKGLLVLYPSLAGVAMVLLAALLWSGQMTGALIIATGAVIFFFGTTLLGVFGPYAAEVYPTEIRATGSGWALGFSRFGAFLAIPLGGLFLGTALPLFTHQLIFGIPLFLAAAVMLALGIETRQRRLEEIAGTPLAPGRAGVD